MFEENLCLIFSGIISAIICLSYAVYRVYSIINIITDKNLGYTLELIGDNKFTVESFRILDKRLSKLEDSVLIVKGD